MMHFFIRPKIHLDCFTNRADVIEYAPVVNGIEAIPSWWKSLPKENTASTFFPTPTMKTCVGMYEYYRKSVAIPMWSDMAVQIKSDKQYNWQFADLNSEAEVHDKPQYSGFLGSDNQAHLKIISPWFFKTKNDVSWIMTDAIYNRSTLRDYTITPGILNFSKQGGTNIQMFVDISRARTFTIPFGSVFLLTPLSDKKVVVHRHLIDSAEHHKMQLLYNPLTFINKYKHKEKLIKCPYKDETK
jgi:hypothetical protein